MQNLLTMKERLKEWVLLRAGKKYIPTPDPNIDFMSKLLNNPAEIKK